MSLDDAAMRNETLDDVCPAANMSGRSLFTARMYHPRRIIEVEGGVVIEQLHVGLPIRIDCADILPVSGKRIGVDTLLVLHHCGDDVAAKVMLGGRIASFSGPRILNQNTDQCFAIKYVNTHRAESAAWFARLLLKGDDPSLGIRFQNTKAMAFLKRHDHYT